MEDLEHIKISFDDGETEVNFAEAAMLIQGSTCVYSRKVEFLYSLVLQTLDLISSRKRSALNIDSSFGPDVDPRDDEDDELLLLDDVLEEARGATINLLESSAGPPSREDTLANLLAETPLALSMNLDQKPGDASFKMLSASVNASGALLLDARDNLVVGNSGDAAAINESLSGTIGGAIPLPSPIASALNQSNGRVSFAVDDNDHDGGGADFDFDGFDDGGGDGDMGSADDGPIGGAIPGVVRQVVRSAAAAAAAAAANVQQEAVDPWARLDPHTEYPELDRPFRRGKTGRAPKESSSETTLEPPATALAFLSALASPSAAALSGSYFKAQFGDYIALEAKRRKAQTRVSARRNPQSTPKGASDRSPCDTGPGQGSSC